MVCLNVPQNVSTIKSKPAQGLFKSPRMYLELYQNQANNILVKSKTPQQSVWMTPVSVVIIKPTQWFVEYPRMCLQFNQN